MKYIIFSLIALTLIAQPVVADSGQYGQYGGSTPVQEITVDKKVSRGIATKGGVIEYVDNFSPTDPRFAPNQKVYFQITVKNTSNAPLSRVKLSDPMPQYIDPLEGPGAYDARTRTISWSYDTIKPGEEKRERIVGLIQTQDKLPSNKGIICLTNTVNAIASSTSTQDSSQLCVEKLVSLSKGGIPQKSPEAGPELGLVLGLLNMATLGTGIYLKKRSQI